MPRSLFLHLYMLRVPITILVTLGWVLPKAFGNSMFHGLGDLQTSQVCLVSLGAFLLVAAAITCAFLVLLYGSERADGTRTSAPDYIAALKLPERMPASGWITGSLCLAGAWVYAYFLWALWKTMETAHSNPQGLFRSFWLNVGLGTALGLACIVIVFVADLSLSSPRDAPQVLVFALPVTYLLRDFSWFKLAVTKLSNWELLGNIPIVKWFTEEGKGSLRLAWMLGPGFARFGPNGKVEELNPGHRFAGLLVLLCLFLYWIAGRYGLSRISADGPFAPEGAFDAVLLQVILLLLLACWLLSSLSFFFDRFRFPVLTSLAVLLVLISLLGPSDHAFHTFAKATSALPTPKSKFGSAPDHIIAVAAAGGGIQAAAWTSQVLCGLRQEIGPDFEKSVLVISGSSGGSVGTMFYLRCLESPKGSSDAARAARNSSLEATAWGLAHPDLRNAVLPIKWISWPGDDRGWALERALSKNANFSQPNRLLAGEDSSGWPVLLFNSTEVRTGDPMVFTNSDFPEKAELQYGIHRLHSFHQLYDGRDVQLQTAVRMSAAFPYVSPAARADRPWNAEHLVDGGYFGNSGVFSLAEWLKEATVITKDQRGRPEPPHAPKKILVIRISSFPDIQTIGPADRPKRWTYQLIAPILTVLHGRSEGQLVRDATEGADLLEILSRRGYEAEAITADYQAASGRAITCSPDPPLTWHLTEVEKNCIDENWNQRKASLVSQVKEFLASPINPIAQATISGEVSNQRLEEGVYKHEMVKQ